MTINAAFEYKISEKAYNAARQICAKINNQNTRKRAFKSLLALDALADYLYSQNFKVDISKNLYKIPQINEEFEFTDLYYNGKMINIVPVVNGEFILIPKTHFACGAIPDLYVAADYNQTTKKVRFLGCIEGKKIDKSHQDEKYFIMDIKNLSEPENIEQFINDIEIKDLTESNHEIFFSFFIDYIDGILDEENKERLIIHLIECKECRDACIEFFDYESIATKTKKYPDIFSDQTLDIVGAAAVNDEKYKNFKEITIEIDKEPDEYEDDEDFDVDNQAPVKNIKPAVEDPLQVLYGKGKNREIFELLNKKNKKSSKSMLDGIVNNIPTDNEIHTSSNNSEQNKRSGFINPAYYTEDLSDGFEHLAPTKETFNAGKEEILQQEENEQKISNDTAADIEVENTVTKENNVNFNEKPSFLEDITIPDNLETVDYVEDLHNSAIISPKENEQEDLILFDNEDNNLSEDKTSVEEPSYSPTVEEEQDDLILFDNEDNNLSEDKTSVEEPSYSPTVEEEQEDLILFDNEDNNLSEDKTSVEEPSYSPTVEEEQEDLILFDNEDNNLSEDKTPVEEPSYSPTVEEEQDDLVIYNNDDDIQKDSFSIEDDFSETRINDNEDNFVPESLVLSEEDLIEKNDDFEEFALSNSASYYNSKEEPFIDDGEFYTEDELIHINAEDIDLVDENNEEYFSKFVIKKLEDDNENNFVDTTTEVEAVSNDNCDLPDNNILTTNNKDNEKTDDTTEDTTEEDIHMLDDDMLVLQEGKEEDEESTETSTKDFKLLDDNMLIPNIVEDTHDDSSEENIHLFDDNMLIIEDKKEEEPPKQTKNMFDLPDEYDSDMLILDDDDEEYEIKKVSDIKNNDFSHSDNNDDDDFVVIDDDDDMLIIDDEEKTSKKSDIIDDDGMLIIDDDEENENQNISDISDDEFSLPKHSDDDDMLIIGDDEEKENQNISDISDDEFSLPKHSDDDDMLIIGDDEEKENHNISDISDDEFSLPKHSDDDISIIDNSEEKNTNQPVNTFDQTDENNNASYLSDNNFDNNSTLLNENEEYFDLDKEENEDDSFLLNIDDSSNLTLENEEEILPKETKLQTVQTEENNDLLYYDGEDFSKDDIQIGYSTQSEPVQQEEEEEEISFIDDINEEVNFFRPASVVDAEEKMTNKSDSQSENVTNTTNEDDDVLLFDDEEIEDTEYSPAVTTQDFILKEDADNIYKLLDESEIKNNKDENIEFTLTEPEYIKTENNFDISEEPKPQKPKSQLDLVFSSLSEKEKEQIMNTQNKKDNNEEKEKEQPVIKEPKKPSKALFREFKDAISAKEEAIELGIIKTEEEEKDNKQNEEIEENEEEYEYVYVEEEVEEEVEDGDEEVEDGDEEVEDGEAEVLQEDAAEENKKETKEEIADFEESDADEVTEDEEAEEEVEEEVEEEEVEEEEEEEETNKNKNNKKLITIGIAAVAFIVLAAGIGFGAKTMLSKNQPDNTSLSLESEAPSLDENTPQEDVENRGLDIPSLDENAEQPQMDENQNPPMEENNIPPQNTAQNIENSPMQPKAGTENATTEDMNKAVANAFSDTPSAISISKVSWGVNTTLSVDEAIRQYVQSTGKMIRKNLQTSISSLKNATPANPIKIQIKFSPQRNFQDAIITKSCGNAEIDEIVLQSVKQTVSNCPLPIIPESTIQAYEQATNNKTVNFSLTVRF